MASSSPSTPLPGYKEILKTDENLALFLRKMQQFDQAFVTEMVGQSDFTLRLEVRGVGGQLTHVRCTCDAFDRPPGTKVPGRAAD